VGKKGKKLQNIIIGSSFLENADFNRKICLGYLFSKKLSRCRNSEKQ
jgi:hypothetical protein